MRRFEYLIYLFLFLLPWQTRLILRPGVLNGGNWEYGIVGIYGTEILLWVIILLSLLRINRHPLSAVRQYLFFAPRQIGGLQKRNWRTARLFYCLIPILFIILIVSILSASNRLIAIQQFIHILEAIAIFILLTKLSIVRLKAAYAFLVGLAMQAVLGIYQFLTQSTFVSPWFGLALHDAAVGGASVLENSVGRWLRAYAGLPHPNIFGGYMAVGVLLIAILLARNLISNKARVFLLITNCFLLTGLFFSFSRSAWLGLVISLLVFWLIGRRQFVSGGSFKLFFLSGVVLLVILSFFYAPLLQNRLSGQGRLEARAVEERVGGYGEAWELFKKHPLGGVGFGNYTLAVYDEIDMSRPAWGYQPAHNVFLLMLAELGVVGVLIILFVIYLARFKINRGLLPFFVLFFFLALFDHYLWSLYSGLALVGAGGGLLYLSFKS